MLDVAFATTSNASLVVKFLAVSFLNNFSMKSQWRFACQDIYWKPSSKPALPSARRRTEAKHDQSGTTKNTRSGKTTKRRTTPTSLPSKNGGMTGASGTTGTAEVPETGPTPAEAIGPGCPLN